MFRLATPLFHVRTLQVLLLGLVAGAAMWRSAPNLEQARAERPRFYIEDVMLPIAHSLLPLVVLPIPGLTTANQRAPALTAVPLGTTLMFRQPAPSGAIVQWSGAAEVVRDDGGSTAECPLNTLGSHQVVVNLRYPNGIEWGYTCDLDVIDIDVAAIQVGPINVPTGPLPLDEHLTNDETMAYCFGRSIATVFEIGEGHYRTSVDRPLRLSVAVDPPAVGPLIEWRINGTGEHLGPPSKDYRQRGFDTYLVSVGPADHAVSVRFDRYSVDITNHTVGADILPEGVPIAFEAVTNPPRNEGDITRLSRTKYGSPAPGVGQGPTLTPKSNDTMNLSLNPTFARVRCPVGLRASCYERAESEISACL